ncbi:MAG: hypothetical protein HYY29_03595 [Chloroflexi bacterium]|nr:hypothetical protein [Chloroflexota bacterium]
MVRRRTEAERQPEVNRDKGIAVSGHARRERAGPGGVAEGEAEEMRRLGNIYFVSETGAAVANAVDGSTPAARAALIAHMKQLGYEQATYRQYMKQRTWQRRQERAADD